jgi:putative transposase
LAYDNSADVADKLPRFIAEIYNSTKPHLAIGYHSPKQFEYQPTQNTVKSAA